MGAMRFSKRDTTLVKGISIILLLLHHTVGDDPGIPMSVLHTPLSLTIGNAGKVCVALFMLLSGYGMMESSRIKQDSGYHFVFARMKKLYFHFWGAWAIQFVWAFVRGCNPLTDIYQLGTNPEGVLYLLRDLFGFFSFGSRNTPTMNGVFWFMEAIVLAYLLFPLLALMFKKTRSPVHVLILAVTYSPWIYYQYKLDFAMHTDRALFYLFSFCLGMFLSYHHVLDRIKQWSSNKRWSSVAMSTVLVIAALFARQRYCLPFDPFFALAIISFCICTILQSDNTPIVTDALMVCGRNEADIYLLHPALLAVFSEIPFSTTLYRCVFTVFLCVAVIDFYARCKYYLKKQVMTLYSKVFVSAKKA